MRPHELVMFLGGFLGGAGKLAALAPGMPIARAQLSSAVRRLRGR